MSRARASRVTSVRRTQEERRAHTRATLLDATLACLLDLGYARMTTSDVCARAGLSRGALLHHFPTKQALVVEAVEHVVKQMGVETLLHAERVACSDAPLARMFEVIWANFEQPLFHAALELWVAARTDPELYAHLVHAERLRGSGILRLYASLAGASARQERFADVLQLTLHLMRGMALQRILRASDTERRRLYELWKSMASAALPNRPSHARTSCTARSGS